MQPTTDTKKNVQAFYDQVGWQARSDQPYADARIFEDLRPVAAGYLGRCHARVGRFLPKQGRYLLDAASGPVQYPEYLDYSRGFCYRVCVDLSGQALRAARHRLGQHGLYVQADVVHLPFKDGCLDAVVSMHTLYHVPAGEQAATLIDIYRLLKPGAAAAVVYSWGRHSLLEKLALLPVRQMRKLVRALRRKAQPSPAATQGLYFHAFPYTWFRQTGWPFELEIRTWRSVSVDFLRAYVHPWLFGRLWLRLVYWLEERLPHLAGRIGQYPLFVFRK